MSNLRKQLALAIAMLICGIATADDKDQPKVDKPAERPIEAIIWTSFKAHSIFAVDLKGERLKNVYDEAEGADSVAADTKTNKLYIRIWTDGLPNGHKIRELDLATGKTRDVITGSRRIVDVALDHEKQKLYWTCSDTGILHRCNIDGSKVEDFVTGLTSPDELAIDEKAGKIYWTEHGGGKVGVINRDGKGRKLLFNNLSSPVMGVAVDNQHGRTYVCLRSAGEIFSSKLDGSDAKTILKDLVNADGIALDVPRDMIYWMDQGGIHSARLDGSDPKEIVLGGTGAYGSVLLVPEMPNLLDEKFEK